MGYLFRFLALGLAIFLIILPDLGIGDIIAIPLIYYTFTGNILFFGNPHN